jgi:hypothetical protein
MTRFAQWLSFLAVLAVCGACVTLAPGAEKVLFTENPSDVAGCKVLGEVIDNRKPTTRAAGQNGLRNAAFAIGGNAVFHTTGNIWMGPWKGTAYLCERGSK